MISSSSSEGVIDVWKMLQIDFARSDNQPLFHIFGQSTQISISEVRQRFERDFRIEDKIKTLIRNQKRIHVSIVERIPSKTAL